MATARSVLAIWLAALSWAGCAPPAHSGNTAIVSVPGAATGGYDERESRTHELVAQAQRAASRDNDAAIALYEEAVKLEPTNHRLLAGLGSLHIEKGAWDEVGRADPPDCSAPVPSFSIADDKGEKREMIAVMG